MGCGMDCKPSESCKEFILSEIEKRLKKETTQRLEFEEMVMDKFEAIEKKVDDNQEAIKALNLVTISKLEEIKDTKDEIKVLAEDAKEEVGELRGQIGLVVEFMQNRGKFERLLSWIPKKYRGPSVLIALGGIIAFVLMYGPTVLEIIKMRWGK